MATLKVCITCGDLAAGTRCEPCRATYERDLNQRRGGATARGYTRQWQAKAATVRRQQPACEVCGTTTDLTTDHVIPKVRGGTDDRDNLRTLCRPCNSSKGGRG